MDEQSRWVRGRGAARVMTTMGVLWVWTSAASAQTATAPATAAVERPAAGVPIPLWPKGSVPMALGTAAEDTPTLTPFYPSTPAATGTVMLVIPGGSYARVSYDHEGTNVAKWLNTLGVTAFVLTYRVGPRYHHPVMLTDAQRAIRYVRTLAPGLKLRDDRLGVMGFSAGGHLASTAGTRFDEGQPSAPDPLDRPSSRPDFLVLCYPVISLVEPYAHKSSRTNLLGEAPDSTLVELLSNERQVTSRTPPTFLFHTDDDPGVRPENAGAFYMALKRAGVPAELHIYQHGRHGVGLAQGDAVLATWPGRLADWLRVRELLPLPAWK